MTNSISLKRKFQDKYENEVYLPYFISIQKTLLKKRTRHASLRSGEKTTLVVKFDVIQQEYGVDWRNEKIGSPLEIWSISLCQNFIPI